MKIQVRQAGRLSYFSELQCGDRGIRTPDLLRARQALSQLSYIPILFNFTKYALIRQKNLDAATILT